MQFLGSVNFYSKFIEKLHINLKPLYTLLHDDVNFQWTPELEKIFQNVKNAITTDTGINHTQYNASIFHNGRCFVSWFRRSLIPNERRKQNESNLL